MKVLRGEFLVIWLAVILTGGCVSSRPPDDPTLQAKIEQFARTATARGISEGSEGVTLQTAIARATDYMQSLQTTQEAVQIESEHTNSATQTAQAPILAELPLYGVDASQGILGWIHEPVQIDIEGYRSEEFANDYSTVTATDFVMAADITWDTKYGASGCGFILRSDGEMEASNQYLIMLSRSANGHAYFLALAEGEVANFKNFYANWLDPAFAWDNGSTNRLAVVAIGPIIQVFTNHTLIGEIDTSQPPPRLPDLPQQPVRPAQPSKNLSGAALANYQSQFAQYQLQLEAYNQLVRLVEKYHSAALKTYYEKDSVYEQGFVGMFAFAYSGYVTCQFNNAWLWLIQETP